jgi:aspartate racemase
MPSDRDARAGTDAPDAPGVLGVLGGMGPFASAEFMRTLYELNTAEPEQGMPKVLLSSDPAFPDRTAAIRAGREREITARLDGHLATLVEAGATRLVTTCITAHYFLDRVTAPARGLLISLVDVVCRDLLAARGRFLLLATDGTRHARIFERAPEWASVAPRVVLPDGADQERVHRMLYCIKRDGTVTGAAVAAIDAIRRRRGADGVVLGCTELHLAWRRLADRLGEDNVVDPLRAVARDLPELMHRPVPVTRSAAGTAAAR